MMRDEERERLIQRAEGRARMAMESNDLEAARRYWREMLLLIEGRTPEQVRRMERARGLAA